MSQRDDLAINLIKIAWMQVGAYPFGGYVRDFLGQKPFVDIDLFFPCEETINIFVKVISIINYSVKSIPSKEEDIPLLGVKQFRKKIVDTLCTEVMIDCFVETETVAASPLPFRKGVDVDINYLWMNPESFEIKSAPWIDLKLVGKRIGAREFEAECTVPRDKINKMIGAGYKWLNPSGFMIPSRAENICSICNGVGELDFGFYKRACQCKLI